MTDKLHKKRAFKITGEALIAVVEISKNTHRNLSGSIEYLILQGYKKHEKEAKLVASLQNEG